MTARTRMLAVVAAVAATAVAVVVGAAALQSRGDDAGSASAAPTRPTGAPPLLLDLGLRDDAESRELARAVSLYEDGQRAEAAALFRRHDSLPAQVGLAVARWPEGTVAELERLAVANPEEGAVRLQLGLARFWAGRQQQALEDWRAVRRIDPDSLAAVRAGDLLFPRFARGIPVFVPGFSAPAGVEGLPPGEQLERLRRDAEAGGVRAKLLYGVALQRVGRPVSARRVFDEAVAADPASVEAQVAAAVARFDKESPSTAFSRLGPLARAHPREPTVRFHLGLLLLWMGNVEEARRQLALAQAAEPDHPLGREAGRFLDRLADVGTG